MAESNKMLGGVLMAFVVAILAITFLVAIADSQVDATEQKTVVNESLTLVNNSRILAVNSQWDSVTRVGNTSVTLVQDTSYTVDLLAGGVTLTGNGSIVAGAYDVSYTYRNVGNVTARSLLNLLTLFFAIATLLFVIGALNPNFREMMGF